MKQVSGKDLIRVLQKRGWQHFRTTGSHHIYGKPGVNVRLSVPVHANRPLKAGLLRHLLKLAQLSEDDL